MSVECLQVDEASRFAQFLQQPDSDRIEYSNNQSNATFVSESDSHIDGTWDWNLELQSHSTVSEQTRSETERPY